MNNSIKEHIYNSIDGKCTPIELLQMIVIINNMLSKKEIINIINYYLIKNNNYPIIKK